MALWQTARVPSGFDELWCEELGSPSGLARLRRRLRQETTGSPTVAEPGRDHWAERLVLIADELTSNALRHGGGPVATALCRTGTSGSSRSATAPPMCRRSLPRAGIPRSAGTGCT